MSLQHIGYWVFLGTLVLLAIAGLIDTAIRNGWWWDD